mmetsp:Transcript_9638/g.26245  ORF Transcript_9638/g.26245 Transcript_9638/m.26245 type:complete len:263 (-) Transcript_9638:28-816(-)
MALRSDDARCLPLQVFCRPLAQTAKRRVSIFVSCVQINRIKRHQILDQFQAVFFNRAVQHRVPFIVRYVHIHLHIFRFNHQLHLLHLHLTIVDETRSCNSAGACPSVCTSVCVSANTVQCRVTVVAPQRGIHRVTSDQIPKDGHMTLRACKMEERRLIIILDVRKWCSNLHQPLGDVHITTNRIVDNTIVVVVVVALNGEIGEVCCGNDLLLDEVEDVTKPGGITDGEYKIAGSEEYAPVEGDVKGCVTIIVLNAEAEISLA